jgi:hypothetical protein
MPAISLCIFSTFLSGQCLQAAKCAGLCLHMGLWPSLTCPLVYAGGRGAAFAFLGSEWHRMGCSVILVSGTGLGMELFSFLTSSGCCPSLQRCALEFVFVGFLFSFFFFRLICSPSY